MEKILSVYKPVGMTPLQLIKKLIKQKPEYKDIKIGYAAIAYEIYRTRVGDCNIENAFKVIT